MRTQKLVCSFADLFEEPALRLAIECAGLDLRSLEPVLWLEACTDRPSQVRHNRPIGDFIAE
jgi:hypothetical protein